MDSCSQKCTPDKIGNWYNIIKESLDTRSFLIQDSSFKTQSGKKIIPVLDVRLRRSASLLTPSTVPQAIQSRLSAEKKLHQMYLNAMQKRTGLNNRGPSVNSVYLSINYESGKWFVFCDAEEEYLGLCNHNIQRSLVNQLRKAIQNSRHLHQGSCCLPVHLSLTLFTAGGNMNHANSLIVNTKCKRIGLFEPQGRLAKFPVANSWQLESELHRQLTSICRQLGYQFIGNISPQCDFQDDNQELCFLWTTWVELVSVVNPWLTPQQIGSYLKHRYRKLVKRPSRRQLALMFANYLREVSDNY
jgi:hypothetical protein